MVGSFQAQVISDGPDALYGPGNRRRGRHTIRRADEAAQLYYTLPGLDWMRMVGGIN